jgi:hypothetical protein
MRWWMWGVVVGVGCVGPRETQLLTCAPRPPEMERRSYDYHDPFPDEAIGPETSTRPRTFQDPRSDTRKSFDLRFLQTIYPSAAGTPVGRGPAWPGRFSPRLSGRERFPIPSASSPPPMSPSVPLSAPAGPIASGVVGPWSNTRRVVGQ